MTAARYLQAYALHRGFKQLTAFGLVDGLQLGPNQLRPIALEHPGLGQCYGDVERGLAAHGREQRVGSFTGDDLLDHLGGDRLDIGAICHLGVGHDGGGVAVHENDLIALLLEGFTRLCPRVVEFTRLADNDRPGAHDQDFLEIHPFGHTTNSLYLLPTVHLPHPGAVADRSPAVQRYEWARRPGPCGTLSRSVACSSSMALKRSNRYHES